jgi:hypothetical protein
VFPIIIILLVPVRLRIMNRYWAVDTLKGIPPSPLSPMMRWKKNTDNLGVDSWACRPGLGNDFRSTGEKRREARDVEEGPAANSEVEVSHEKAV